MCGCPSCGYQGMLHRHGHYDRNVITLHEHFMYSVQRFKCPSCNKTYSHLPFVLIPYFIYSFDVIIFCLYSSFSLTQKANEICRFLNSCNKDCFICAQSITFFKKRFLSKINLVNSFFASIDSFHYDSDLSKYSKTIAANKILIKILHYDSIRCFNVDFFKQMPQYFLSS
jgi:hypothetical protein